MISGGITPSFTTKEVEEMGVKIISEPLRCDDKVDVVYLTDAVFSLVSCVAAVHGIRAAMQSLKQTGTDFTSAQGMDPRAFFEVMGM